MKKWIFCAVLSGFIFLCGCAGQQKVGVCLQRQNDPVTRELEEELTQSLQQAGFRVAFCYAGMDQAQQHSQIRQFLDENVDYLVVEPVMAAEMETAAALAAGQETPLIFLEVSAEEAFLSRWDGVRFVSSRRQNVGNIQRELLLQVDDDEASLGCLVIRGPEDFLDGTAWAEDACRGLNCLAVEYGDWTRDSGRTIAGRAMGKYGEELDVIFCHNPQMALGALEAAKDHGRTVREDLQIVALSLDWPLLEKIHAGEITGTVYPDTGALAEGILDHLLGRSRERVIWADFAQKTAETG